MRREEAGEDVVVEPSFTCHGTALGWKKWAASPLSAAAHAFKLDFVRAEERFLTVNHRMILGEWNGITKVINLERKSKNSR